MDGYDYPACMCVEKMQDAGPLRPHLEFAANREYRLNLICRNRGR